MVVLTFAPPLLPCNNQKSLLLSHQNSPLCLPRRKLKKITPVTVARLFGPAIFEASKLKVVFLEVDGKKHPGMFPRTYTLTHSDISSNLTLAISHTINNSQLQGWYNWLQRDEVVAEWKKVKGKMSLHVHCHISGGHFLLDFFARLRFFIFTKELPVVLKAFFHGDGSLFNNYPELQEAMVWVYFHSNIQEFNRVECWGPLVDAAAGPTTATISSSGVNDQQDKQATPRSNRELPQPCQDDCTCCFLPFTMIQRSSPELPVRNGFHSGTHPSFQQPNRPPKLNGLDDVSCNGSTVENNN